MARQSEDLDVPLLRPSEKLSRSQPRPPTSRFSALQKSLLASVAVIGVLSFAYASQSRSTATSYRPAVRHVAVNGLQPTPQMGWNSWNVYYTGVNEDVILSTARAIVDTGLRDLGYSMVGIDDVWQATERAADGQLQHDPGRFPRGIKALADDIHAMGLTIGIYSSAGTLTCAKYPASLDREETDAQTFADWGIDYLKYDNCGAEMRYGNQTISFNRFDAMSRALRKTGRDIVYSLCQWGEDESWVWAPKTANSFRITGDIGPSYDYEHSECPCQHAACWYPGFRCSILNILRKAGELGYREAGVWQDLDGLEVGNKGMTVEEEKVHFTLWAMLKSPLLLSHKIQDMTEDTFKIISNKRVIAVNQDSLGIPATLVFQMDMTQTGTIQWWQGPLSGGRYVIAIHNTDHDYQRAYAPYSTIFRGEPKIPKRLRLENLWSDEVEYADEHYVTVVPPHAHKSFIVYPDPPAEEGAIAGGLMVKLRRW